MCERRKQDMENTTFKTDFCGELQFNIHTWGNNKSMYQDTAHTRLEEKIISIVARLELHAEAIKENRIWAEQQRIKREEEERRQQIYQAKKEKELAKFQSLFTIADRHFKANIIRQYVCSYEEQLKTRSITDEEILAELAWAKDKADWLDPLTSKPDETSITIIKIRLRNRKTAIVRHTTCHRSIRNTIRGQNPGGGSKQDFNISEKF